MRENWAKFIVVFTGLLVVLLAYMFADSQNPVDRTASSKTESLIQDLARVEVGRKIFNQQMWSIMSSFRKPYFISILQNHYNLNIQIQNFKFIIILKRR